MRKYSTNVRRKLDVRTRLEGVMAAVRLGVLEFDDDGRETDGSLNPWVSSLILPHPECKTVRPVVRWRSGLDRVFRKG